MYSELLAYFSQLCTPKFSLTCQPDTPAAIVQLNSAPSNPSYARDPKNNDTIHRADCMQAKPPRLTAISLECINVGILYCSFMEFLESLLPETNRENSVAPFSEKHSFSVVMHFLLSFELGKAPFSVPLPLSVGPQLLGKLCNWDTAQPYSCIRK